MSDDKFCPKCGKPLPVNAPSGLCPRCLYAAAVLSGGATCADTASPASSGRMSFVPLTPEELSAKLPHLEILELIGRGGMGAVYKARQRELGRIVAVKILPPEIGEEPSFAERFTREARALATLNHPNIVSVHDVGEREGVYFFVMEYVDGLNLRETIQAGKLTPEEALAIIPQICDALQYAHLQGIVHRDIKPENILIDRSGRLKIADFGLAKLVESDIEGAVIDRSQALTGSHQIMGTPHYMAPEQLQGSRGIDHRVDIYALGVVFYEMLTGELPIGRFQPPSSKVQIDVRLDEVVLRSLEAEPDRRYQQAQEIKTDIDLLTQDKPLARTREYAITPDVSGLDREHVKLRLQAPAVSIVVYALASLACWIAYYGSSLRQWFESGLGDVDYVMVGSGAILLGMSLLAVIGAVCMKHAKSFFWSNLACVILFIPWTPLWFLGIWLGIWVRGVLSQDEVRSLFVQHSMERISRSHLARRMSRKAIWGAIWGATSPTILLLFVSVSTVSPDRPNTPAIQKSISTSSTAVEETTAMEADDVSEHVVAATPLEPDEAALPAPEPEHVVNGFGKALLMVLVIIGLTSPIGTTFMGALAIYDIRRSKGRLFGLPLAVADAIVFPLLFLDLLILGTVSVIMYFLMSAVLVESNEHVSFAFVLVFAGSIAVPLVLAVDALIVTLVWKNARKGL